MKQGIILLLLAVSVVLVANGAAAKVTLLSKYVATENKDVTPEDPFRGRDNTLDDWEFGNLNNPKRCAMYGYKYLATTGTMVIDGVSYTYTCKNSVKIPSGTTCLANCSLNY